MLSLILHKSTAEVFQVGDLCKIEGLKETFVFLGVISYNSADESFLVKLRGPLPHFCFPEFIVKKDSIRVATLSIGDRVSFWLKHKGYKCKGVIEELSYIDISSVAYRVREDGSTTDDWIYAENCKKLIKKNKRK